MEGPQGATRASSAESLRGDPRRQALAQADRHSLWWLLAGNVLTLMVAVGQASSVAAMLWPFWLQSLAIGWFNARRIRALGAFSTRGLMHGRRRVQESEGAKRSAAIFFLVHYGGFHLAYALFLLAFAMPAPSEWGWILLSVPLLVLAQASIHRRDCAIDALGRPSLALMMVAPYLRAVPMHLILCVGVYLAPDGLMALTVTVLFKTLGDIATHAIERRLHARSDADSG